MNRFEITPAGQCWGMGLGFHEGEGAAASALSKHFTRDAWRISQSCFQQRLIMRAAAGSGMLQRGLG
jgi:hypothetical protein